MVSIRVIFFLFFIVFMPVFYYWGYLCGKQKSDYTLYHATTVRLMDDLLMLDALSVNDEVFLKKNLLKMIELEFDLLVGLYDAGVEDSSVYIRCVVSRRIRSLKNDGLIYEGDASVSVVGYLKNECLGQPSPKNWFVETPRD